MKCFLDRLGFIFHRPRYFGKTFTSIVVQGIYGGGKIVGYFNFIGSALGFNVVKGICLNTLDPVTEKQRDKNNKHIDKLGKKFYAMLIQRKLPVPSLFELMIFRMSRKRIRTILDENYRDYNYYKDHGWFESDFYYPVHLNPIKKMVGRLFDLLN